MAEPTIVSAPAVVYLWSRPDPARKDGDTSAVEAHQRAEGFAAQHGYVIVGRHRDVTDESVPGNTSAFARMLEQLDAEEIRVVLVPGSDWLASDDDARQERIQTIADHGGTPMIIDASVDLDHRPAGPHDRRLIAQRFEHPDGVVEACDAIEAQYGGWTAYYAEPILPAYGPTGFYAKHTSFRFPEQPLYGETPDELRAAIEAHIAEEAPPCDDEGTSKHAAQALREAPRRRERPR